MARAYRENNTQKQCHPFVFCLVKIPFYIWYYCAHTMFCSRKWAHIYMKLSVYMPRVAAIESGWKKSKKYDICVIWKGKRKGNGSIRIHKREYKLRRKWNRENNKSYPPRARECVAICMCAMCICCFSSFSLALFLHFSIFRSYCFFYSRSAIFSLSFKQQQQNEEANIKRIRIFNLYANWMAYIIMINKYSV